MLNLNFSTAEELIFWDSALQRKLDPDLFSVFEQWRLAKRVPMLREIGKQAILDFLNMVSEEDVAVLEEHFGEKIVVEKLNYTVAMNLKIPLAESKVCEELCKVEGFNYFSTWRDDEYLYISAWR